MLPDNFDFAMIPEDSKGRLTLKEVGMLASTIEDIDYAMVSWLKEDLNLSAQTNEGYVNVPVLWQSPERAFQVKNAKDLREHFSKLNGDQEKALEEQRLDMTAVMDDVKGRVAQNFAHFTNIAGGLEAKATGIESKIVSTVQSIADTREKFSGLCSRLETEIREDRRMNTEIKYLY